MMVYDVKPNTWINGSAITFSLMQFLYEDRTETFTFFTSIKIKMKTKNKARFRLIYKIVYVHMTIPENDVLHTPKFLCSYFIFYFFCIFIDFSDRSTFNFLYLYFRTTKTDLDRFIPRK